MSNGNQNKVYRVSGWNIETFELLETFKATYKIIDPESGRTLYMPKRKNRNAETCETFIEACRVLSIKWRYHVYLWSIKTTYYQKKFSKYGVDWYKFLPFRQPPRHRIPSSLKKRKTYKCSLENKDFINNFQKCNYVFYVRINIDDPDPYKTDEFSVYAVARKTPTGYKCVSTVEHKFKYIYSEGDEWSRDVHSHFISENIIEAQLYLLDNINKALDKLNEVGIELREKYGIKV